MEDIRLIMNKDDQKSYDINIIGTEMRITDIKSYTVYILKLTEKLNNNEIISWRIAKRYNDFHTLHEKLVSKYGNLSIGLPELPSKWTNTEERKKAFQVYLDRLIGDKKNLQIDVIINFFELDRNKVEILYRTQSLCARCVVIDRKPLQFIDASVVSKDFRVFLVTNCQIHGSQEVLYFGDKFFFQKMLSFSLQPLNTDKVIDIEDIEKRTSYVSQTANHPLLMEVPVVKGDDFYTNEDITKKINNLLEIQPPNKKFILKIAGKLSKNMRILNEKAKFIESLVPKHPIMLEVSHDRLMVLAGLEDSIFRISHVYPAVKYFLKKGEEETCYNDLQKLIESLLKYEGIQMAVTISLDRPFPSIGKILELLRGYSSLVRIIFFSLERSPKQLLEYLKEKPSETMRKKFNEELNPLETIDSYELLKLIEKDSGCITVDDFFPASLSVCLEPFLNMIGHGLFSFRTNPFCGFFSCLMNTPEIKSSPINKHFDLLKFFCELKPLLNKLENTIGWNMGRKIKNIFNSCILDPKHKDLFNFFIDPNKAKETKEFIDNLQFIAIHNNMDIAALDRIRRCDCSSVTVTDSPLATKDLAASCIGCL